MDLSTSTFEKSTLRLYCQADDPPDDGEKWELITGSHPVGNKMFIWSYWTRPLNEEEVKAAVDVSST